MIWLFWPPPKRSLLTLFFSLSLSLSLSLCTSALSQILISQTLDSLKLQKTPNFTTTSLSFSLSLSLSLSVRVLGALSNPVSVCVRFAFLDLSRSLSFSFLLKFRDPTTVRFLIWRKASSIYQTISSHLSRPITPGPPKVLPTTTTSPCSSRSLLHSFAFNVYRCFFFFFTSRFAYVFDGFDRCGFDARFRALLIWNHL